MALKKGLNTISIARTAFVVCKLQKLSKIYVQSVAHSVLMPVKSDDRNIFVLAVGLITEAKHFLMKPTWN